MRWSIKLVKIAGIEVRMHLTFLLLLAWIGFEYYQKGGAPAAVSGITFILLIFLCVILHEFGHAMAAKAFGIQTPDITLLPIGGVARLQRMPDKPWQELIVAIAGPLVNVVIAGVLFLALGLRMNSELFEKLASPTGSVLPKVAVVNVMLVVFNLIPAFPMDGGRVLRSLLAMVMPHSNATMVAARIGQALAFVFGFLGLFGNPLLIFIALFVYLGASQENAMAQMKDVTSGVHVRDAMVTEIATLGQGDTIDHAIETLLRTSQHEFPVLDESERVLGILTREPMIRALKESGPHTPVIDVMQRCERTVHPGDNFEGAFRLMQESACPALPVVDDADRLVGLITPENVGELMMVRSILRAGEMPAWRQARQAAP
ncbi:MAG: site-2 protease family protein [Verrucomicrobiae bacterium]|nr:site-2 protease family protein [Verrucomicrobiae bacterium]